MQIESIIKPEFVAQYRQQGFWSDKTLGQHFDEIVKKNSPKTAIIYKDQAITYSQLGDQVNKIAAGLIETGLQKGDVLSVQLPNWPEFIYFVYAAIKNGIIFNPIHVPYRKRELEFILRFSNSKAMIIPDQFGKFDFPAMIQEIWPQLPNLKRVWVVGDKAPEGMSCAVELLNKRWSSEELKTLPASQNPTADAPFLLMYTSGTESDPKGVVHSHNTIGSLGGYITKGLGVYPEDVVFTASPFSHAMGILLGPWATIHCGSQLVIQETFVPEETIKFIDEYQVTFFVGAPSHIVAMLQVPGFSQYQLSSLRTFFTGGASCPVEVVKEATSRFGCQLSSL